MISILIADNQRLLRESFKSIIESNSDMEVVACAADGKEAFRLCSEFTPDVVLMDISMPECKGIQSTKLIKSKYPNIKVLILTTSKDDDKNVSEAIRNGADGYVLTNISAEELILSIKCATSGFEIIQKDVFKPAVLNISFRQNETAKRKIANIEGIDTSLTEREITIIQMIVEGKSNKEISASLFIAEGTVKNTLTEIMSKLQLKDRTQLAVYAIKNNLASLV